VNFVAGSGSEPTRPACACTALAWSLSGLILLLTSLRLPFVTAAKFGQDNEGRMLSGVISLWGQGHGLLAALVAFCGLVAPLALLVAVAIVAAFPRAAALHPFIRGLEPWSMPEVRMLAIIVAFVKLSAVVQATPAAGLWCYGAAAVCSLAATRSLPPHVSPPKPTHAGAARRVAAACGLGAVLLLVPAYALPVMSFTRLGHDHADTLFASVLKLWQGGLWGIALIVFAASLLVPVLKLVALGVLLAADRRSGWMTPDTQARLHRVVHAVGRWSMLDVFLVAFLCGIVHFGSLARFEARPGVLVFAGAVVLTMLATAALESIHHRPAGHSSPPP
jgi:paraquat-inducible protein A